MNLKDLFSSLFTYTPNNKETYNFNLVEDLNTKVYPDSTLGKEGNEKTKIFPNIAANTNTNAINNEIFTITPLLKKDLKKRAVELLFFVFTFVSIC